MDADTVLGKTDKGRDEIATRAFRLGPRERSLLIVVDGESTAAQLQAKFRHIANAGEILELLLREGFVEIRAAVPPREARAAGAAGAAESDPTLAAAVRYGRRFVVDALGPGGDSLAEKLEACRSWADLEPVVEKCAEVLQMAVGRRKAEEFRAGVAAQRPPAAGIGGAAA